MKLPKVLTWGKRKVSFLSVLLIVIAVTAVSVLATLTKAQSDPEAQGLEISPPSQELTVDPGGTYTIKAKIRNRTPISLPVTARLEDFVATGELGGVALSKDSTYAITSWSSLAPTEFTLGAGESREVTATVRVPKSGVAGGRYGSIVFAVVPKSQKNTAVIGQEVASLFLLRVSGPVEEKIALEGFKAPLLSEFGPIKFALQFKNSGNIHLKPAGVISITDMFGRKVADVKVDGTNVFPQATRIVTVDWNEKFLIGKYSANAILNSGGNKNQSLQSSVEFFVFPVRIAVLIGLVVLVLYLLRKRLQRALGALAGK